MILKYKHKDRTGFFWLSVFQICSMAEKDAGITVFSNNPHGLVTGNIFSFKDHTEIVLLSDTGITLYNYHGEIEACSGE